MVALWGSILLLLKRKASPERGGGDVPRSEPVLAVVSRGSMGGECFESYSLYGGGGGVSVGEALPGSGRPTGFRRMLAEDKSVADDEDVSMGSKEERRSPHFRDLFLAECLGGDGGSGALGKSYFIGFTAWLVRLGEPLFWVGKKS